MIMNQLLVIGFSSLSSQVRTVCLVHYLAAWWTQGEYSAQLYQV